MSALETTGHSLSVDAARLVDELCDQFELAWQRGERPQWETVLADAPHQVRQSLLEELLRLETFYRRQCGETPAVCDYVNRFVELPPTTIEKILGSQDQTGVLTVAAGPPSHKDSEPARYFGDYELLAKIANGGMGVVYKARQISLHRQVAVKMILSGRLASEVEVKRFYAEASLAAQLDHPNIVSVYEVGDHDGQHFFSMALVEGVSLDARLKHGPLDPLVAARIVKEVALAIEYAHAKGVIHRDLKPSNILLDAQQRPRVTDFGLAKCTSDATGLTLTGDIVGTPSYMPPEQASGNPGASGPAADIYSLGAVLYALLCGRPPFHAASSVATLRQVIDQEPARLRQLNSALPRDLETIVSRCLEKRPERRFGSAQELAEELDRFLEGRPIRTRPINWAERLVRWSRREPVVAALILIATCAILIGSATSVFFGIRASQKAYAEHQRSQELVRALYRSQVMQAYLEWQAGNLTRAEELLDSCDESLRNWEWRFLKQLCHPERLEFRGADERVRQVVFDPAGRRLITAGMDETKNLGAVRRWDLKTSQELSPWDCPAPVMSVACSQDGALVAAGLRNGTVMVWKSDSIKEEAVHQVHVGNVYRVAFQPNSHLLATSGEDGSVKVLDALSGVEKVQLKQLPANRRTFLCATFDHSGTLLAAAGDHDVILIWDVKTGDLLHTIDTGTKVITRGLAFTPDGRRILSADTNSQFAIRVWDVATQQMLTTLVGHQGPVRTIQVSADGLQVASGGKDGNLILWDLETGLAIRTWKAHNLSVDGVVFHPQVREIATCGMDNLIRVWDLDSSPEVLRSAERGEAVNEIAFSHDSQRLVSANKDGVVRLCDTELNEVRAMKTAHRGKALAVAFGPQGKWIVSGGDDGQVLLHDAETGEFWKRVVSAGKPIWSVDVDAQTNRIVYAGDEGSFHVWDVAQEKEVEQRMHHPQGIACVRFSPSGEMIASCGGDGKVRLWRKGVKEPLHTWGHGNGKAWNVAFSHDGKWLASAGNDGTIVIWNLTTGTRERTLRGHTGVVYSVSFSPNSSRLVSGGLDQTVKVWEPTSGLELLSLREPIWSVNSVAFSPDGLSIAAGSSDSFVRMWRANLGRAGTARTATAP